MNNYEAFKIIARFLKQEKLNHLQELIFCESWKGKTYREIAELSGYTEEYIRENGASLWQLISKSLEEKVNKQNCKQILENYFLQQEQITENTHKNPKYHQDWEEAIDISFFFGRNDELTILEKWIVEDECRLIGIFGIGGIGKTSLTVKLTQQIVGEFDFVIWRSLRNAPPLSKLLANIIQVLSNQQEIEQNLPENVGERISKLIAYLKSRRCLLILDNGETILQSGITCGRYREGYEAYGELFQRLGEINHQSCIILTSRENPQEFSILEGNKTPVRSLQVTGVETETGKEICQLKGEFCGSEQDWQTLTYNYSGNPLAFKIVASTIQDLFDGDVSQFLQQGIFSFDDIEDLLNEQLDRLSNLEREVMYWLAIEREAISLEQLQQNLLVSIPSKKLLEAIKSLTRRSLIEKTATGFTQQPVVMEYLSERQIEKVAHEIADLTPDLLTTHALIKAQTQEYIRQIQTRVTLQPLANKLLARYEDLEEIEIKLKQIIAELKQKSQAEVGYAIGNIINLLQQLEIDLSNYDFSHTSIRQAYLRNLDLHQVKLSHSHFQDSIFSESIDFIFDVAFNHQGDILASGHQNGDIYLWSIPSGKKIRAWKAHNDWFDSLVFSPDGWTIASGTKDEEVKLWSVKTGKLIKTLRAYIMPHSNLVFHPNGEILICATRDRNIQLWKINTGKCYKILQADRERIISLAISSDGYRLACGYIDGTVEIWNLSTFECNKTIDANTAASFSTISPDGRYIYTGCIDTRVKQWDLETGICLKEFVGHTNQIYGMDLNSQGNMLATADLDNNIRIWDVNTGRCLNVLQDHENTIYEVAFSPNGQILASGGLDYSVRLWSIPSGQPLKSLRGYQSKI
ncbi:MAG: NB-ARC domain-containing protein [Pleurocapsa sp. MO_226.B13]|nr:NB-ARC domain-containing protein [Pleurocapsa sp. MO_226.B13]